MNILKYSLFLIILIISKINCITPILPSEETAAYTLASCFGFSQSDDLCLPNRLICEQIPDSQYYTITGINFNTTAGFCMINDISTFKNLTYVNLIGNLYITSPFMENLYQLTKLETLIIKPGINFSPNISSFPDSLKIVKLYQYSSNITNIFFESKIETLDLSTFAYPPPLLPVLNKTNSYMKNLYISLLPAFNESLNSFGQYLPNLEGLTLIVDNSNPWIQPDYNLFSNLKFLNYTFTFITYNNPFPSSLCNSLTNLEYLEVFQPGLLFNSTEGIDFRNCKPGFKLVLHDMMVLPGCTIDPCILFPANSSLELSNSNIMLKSISFDGLVNFYSDLNDYYSDALPDNINIINPSNFNSFMITNARVYGTVPDIYCNFKTSNISFFNNFINKIPSCFLCGYRDIFSGNSINIDNPICTDFSLSLNDSLQISTSGSKITFEGDNLGWEYSIYGDTYTLEVPNKKFTIEFPSGVGKEFQYPLVFQNGEKTETLQFSYYPPHIDSYKLDLDSFVFYIFGTNFNWNDLNNATIQGIENVVFSFDKQTQDSQISSTSFDSFLDNLVDSTTYQLQFNIGDQQSNVIEFLYFSKQIQITDKNIQIELSGGHYSINGVFSTTNTSLVNCTLGSTELEVVSVSSNLLTLDFPSSNTEKTVTLYLDIGGRTTQTQVKYVKNVDPNSSSDDISNSNILTINFNLLLLLLLISNIFIIIF